MSVSSTGRQAARRASDSPAISADGRIVAFASLASNLVAGDANDTGDIVVRNRATGKTHRVSISWADKQAALRSFSPAISANGRLVAFHSHSRLVPHDTNGSAYDVFLRNRTTGLPRAKASPRPAGRATTQASTQPSHQTAA